jgi:hypothetical protein
MQNQIQILPSRAKPAQAQQSFSKEKSLGFPWILFAEMSLFKELR